MEEGIPSYKISFIGDQYVGKSSIINRFLNDTFIEEYKYTLGLDFETKKFDINSTNINLLFYDIGGQEKFRSLIPLYVRDSNIFLFIYDITNKDSFIHIEDLLKEITNVNKLDECILVLVGNKKDLENKRAVTLKEGEDFAKEKGFIFSEVSSKTGEGINDLFYNKLFNKMIKKFNIKKGAKEDSNPVKIVPKLNEESNKEEEAEQDNRNNSEIDNKFNIGYNQKDSTEIINDLINQNNEIELDKNFMIDPKNNAILKAMKK